MPARRDINILIVDDNKTVRMLLQDILEHAGFENAIEANSGKQAWEHLKTHTIDLVITDWDMAGMDGLTLLKKIRSNVKTKNVPVIMVTVHTKKGYVDRALKAGANNFIAKPFDAGVIIKKINMVFDRPATH